MVNNRVFQVLPALNDTILPAGQLVTALGIKQIGIFDAKTNLSIDASTAANVTDYYIAVGVDDDGDGVLDDVIKTTPEHLKGSETVFYGVACPNDGVDKVMDIDLTNCIIECETDFTFAVEIRNGEQYSLNGYNQNMVSYSVKTLCCEGCCEGADNRDASVDLAIKMVNAVNNDEGANNILSASFVDLTDPNNPVIIPDINVWAAANPTSSPSVRITISALGYYNYCCINPQYFLLRQSDAIISLRQGFECCGTVTTVTDLEYPTGDGYDLQQLEYIAGGWDGNPGVYRTGDLLGLPFSKKRETSFVKNTKYFQVNVSVDSVGSTGWTKAPHAVEYIIATNNTAAAKSGVVDPLIATLDVLLKQPEQATKTNTCTFV